MRRQGRAKASEPLEVEARLAFEEQSEGHGAKVVLQVWAPDPQHQHPGELVRDEHLGGSGKNLKLQDRSPAVSIQQALRVILRQAQA